MITSVTNFVPVKYLYAGRTTPPSVTASTSAAAAASMPESKSAFDFAMNYLANNTNTPSSHSPTTNATTQFTTSPPPPPTHHHPPPVLSLQVLLPNTLTQLLMKIQSKQYQVSEPPTSLQQAAHAQQTTTNPPPTTVTLQPANDINHADPSSSSYQLSSDKTTDSPFTTESSPKLAPPLEPSTHQKKRQ